MDGTMNIWQLEEYAKENGGYKTGRFIAINEKGIFEFQWLDAYYGLVQIIKDGQAENSFIKTSQLREIFGDDQKYFPTIGYETPIDTP